MQNVSRFLISVALAANQIFAQTPSVAQKSPEIKMSRADTKKAKKSLDTVRQAVEKVCKSAKKAKGCLPLIISASFDGKDDKYFAVEESLPIDLKNAFSLLYRELVRSNSESNFTFSVGSAVIPVLKMQCEQPKDRKKIICVRPELENVRYVRVDYAPALAP
jgi:hypothetical protein